MNKTNTLRIRIASLLIFAIIMQTGIPVNAAQIKVTDTGQSVSSNVKSAVDTGSRNSTGKSVNVSVPAGTASSTASDKAADKAAAKTADKSSDKSSDKSPDKTAEDTSATINIKTPAPTPTPAAEPAPANTPAAESVPAEAAPSQADKEDRASGGGSKFSLKNVESGIREVFALPSADESTDFAPDHAGDTTWQEYYEYCFDARYIGDETKDAIILNGDYKGNAQELLIPAKAVIDGKEYITVIIDCRINNTEVKSVRFEKGVIVESMYMMFLNCSAIMSIDLSGIDTTELHSMDYTFKGCSSLKSVDFSGFDTSNVTGMYDMFSGCSSLTTVDLSGFTHLM